MPISINAETKVAAIKLLESGNKIEAIKLIREQSGSGLKEAKEFVDSLVEEHNKNLPDNQKIGKSGCLVILLIGSMLVIGSYSFMRFA